MKAVRERTVCRFLRADSDPLHPRVSPPPLHPILRHAARSIKDKNEHGA